MTARGDMTAAVLRWRDDLSRPPITPAEILDAAHGRNPKLVARLRSVALAAMCRTQRLAERQPTPNAGQGLAREASDLAALAALLEHLK